MNPHEYAAIFPMATPEELSEMAVDIKQRGLLEPIVILDGKILDGRNRAKACEMAGVLPTYTTYQGHDPLGDVISWNLHRRHLKPSQLAAIALQIKPMFEEQARKRMQIGINQHSPRANLPEGSKGKAVDQAAAAVGVGGRLVQDAEKVRRESPKLFEEVKAGNLTVNAATKQIKESKSEKKETEGKPTQAPARPKSNAMQHASDAIGCLRQIRQNDPVRSEAFRTVVKWVTDNE